MSVFISTYCLSNFSKPVSPIVACFHLVEFPLLRRSYFNRLKQIVRHARSQNEDAILIVRDLNLLPEMAKVKTQIFKGIHQTVSNNITFLLLAGIVKQPSVEINSGISYIYEIDHLEGFIITRPLFDLILNLENIPEKRLSIESFFNNLVLRKACLTHIVGTKNKTEQLKFNIIIPFRNVEGYIGECCQTILEQSYSNYHVYLINDCSTDKSVENIPQDKRFTIVNNRERR